MRQNKALHPTAYSFVPFARASLPVSPLPAAGELGRSAAARGVSMSDTLRMSDFEAFLERHQNTWFRHSEMLFACLKSGECTFSSASQVKPNSSPCSHFLDIFQARLKHLQQFETPYARNLHDDVAAFCLELAKSPSERVQLWTFHKPPHFDITVYEAVESKRVLGCFFAVDRRKIDEKEWRRLWHEDGD